MALANHEAVDKARKSGAARGQRIPAMYVKAAKKKIKNPHTDGPHSSN